MTHGSRYYELRAAVGEWVDSERRAGRIAPAIGGESHCMGCDEQDSRFCLMECPYRRSEQTEEGE